MQPSVELQAFLDATIASLGAKDPNVGRNRMRVALVDLGRGDVPPRLAHDHGEIPVYPASVVKFVYLMAAYAWQEDGKLQIDVSDEIIRASLVTHQGEIPSAAAVKP